MEKTFLLSQLEAVLFAAGEPLAVSKLAQALQLTEEELRPLLEEYRQELEQPQRGFRLVWLEDCVQLTTKREHEEVVKEALQLRKNAPLSNAALEVLAIVAYNQPVTKSFVEQVRGVDSSSIVNSLTEKELLQEAGRLDVPGHPILYETTPNFLRCFGLSSLEELPKLPDESGQLKMDDVMAAQEAEEASQQEE